MANAIVVGACTMHPASGLSYVSYLGAIIEEFSITIEWASMTWLGSS